MPSLFSDLSFLWSAKAVTRLFARAASASAKPFEVLHRIHWSAPWQECSAEQGCYASK